MTLEELAQRAGENRRGAGAKPVDVALRDGALKQARAAIHRAPKESAESLRRALLDNDLKWFAAKVLWAGCPRKLLHPLLNAAIAEPNVSFNAQFLEPVARHYPLQDVVPYLQRRYRDGDADIKQRVLAVMYHVPYAYLRLKDVEVLPSLAVRMRDFLAYEHVPLRRQILCTLPLLEIPTALQAEAEKIVHICRTNEDRFLRGRLAVQLHESAVIPCLPDSESTTS